MAPLSNAEKCRGYRMKNAETYRKADALRKREYRKVSKAKNPLANENRLKLQREKKRIYDEKSRKQNKENPTSPSSFRCPATRKRSLKKVVKALPKNPKKRIKIVKSLASKFDLRIKLDNKRLGRSENALSDEEQTWLSKILDRPDITYSHRGKNNQRYVGKENEKSVFLFIEYLFRRFLINN